MSSAAGGTDRDAAGAASVVFDCKRCKMNAAGLGASYHKGHDEKCPYKKKKTKGLSSSMERLSMIIWTGGESSARWRHRLVLLLAEEEKSTVADSSHPLQRMRLRIASKSAVTFKTLYLEMKCTRK